jgi:hypothetical protein
MGDAIRDLQDDGYEAAIARARTPRSPPTAGV